MAHKGYITSFYDYAALARLVNATKALYLAL